MPFRKTVSVMKQALIQYQTGKKYSKNEVIASKNDHSIDGRGGVWPGKNHKYFIKHKLDIEY